MLYSINIRLTPNVRLHNVEKQNKIISTIILAIHEDLKQDTKELGNFSFRTFYPGIDPSEVVET